MLTPSDAAIASRNAEADHQNAVVDQQDTSAVQLELEQGTEPGTGSGTGSGSGSRTEPGTGPSTGSGPESGTGSGAGPGTGSGSASAIGGTGADPSGNLALGGTVAGGESEEGSVARGVGNGAQQDGTLAGTVAQDKGLATTGDGTAPTADGSARLGATKMAAFSASAAPSLPPFFKGGAAPAGVAPTEAPTQRAAVEANTAEVADASNIDGVGYAGAPVVASSGCKCSIM